MAVKGASTQTHLSTEMIMVIRLEMFIAPSMGPSTVPWHLWLQYSPKSSSISPRKLNPFTANMRRRKLISATARLRGESKGYG